MLLIVWNKYEVMTYYYPVVSIKNYVGYEVWNVDNVKYLFSVLKSEE